MKAPDWHLRFVERLSSGFTIISATVEMSDIRPAGAVRLKVGVRGGYWELGY